MFRQIWKKYLSVITILMKRSAVGEQVLNMNHTDFERAAGGKKVKFSFSNLLLDNGRMDYHTRQTALATDLVLVLQENEHTSKLLKHRQYEFSMNSEFQLFIKNNTPPAWLPADAQQAENKKGEEPVIVRKLPDSLPADPSEPEV